MRTDDRIEQDPKRSTFSPVSTARSIACQSNGLSYLGKRLARRVGPRVTRATNCCCWLQQAIQVPVPFRNGIVQRWGGVDETRGKAYHNQTTALIFSLLIGTFLQRTSGRVAVGVPTVNQTLDVGAVTCGLPRSKRITYSQAQRERERERERERFSQQPAVAA